MTCKSCGHDGSLHNRILNSALCPFDYVDGECIGTGDRVVSHNPAKWRKLKDYTIDRMLRGYGYGTKKHQSKSKPYITEIVEGYMKDPRVAMVCGCLKFIPAEEPCKK